jgi:DNA-binding MarR family transcriptional regulator
MNAAPQPLTKTVGKTERSLQALLASQLVDAGLSFPEWTVLVFLSNGPLATETLLAAMADGEIARGSEAYGLLAEMEAKGLVQSTVDKSILSDSGKALFLPLRASVQSISSTLVAGVSEADLEVTNRTLAVVGARAQDLLSKSRPKLD